MKIKHIAFAICSVLLTALLLLFLWKMGLMATGQGVPPEIREKVTQDGVYAELRINPEAGILTGDVLRVEINAFFYHSRIEIDEKLIAERYLSLKEQEFSGCEEYGRPQIERKKIGKITRILLATHFQCFFTKPRQGHISFMVQYVDIEEKQTNTINLSKTISFAEIPATSPRDLKSHTHENNDLDAWLVALGTGLLSGSIVLALAHAYYRKRMEKMARQITEPKEIDHFTSAILSLRARLLESKNYCEVLDKLYHLCGEIIEERGRSDELEDLKKKLLLTYDPTASIDEYLAETYLDKAERIARNGGGAE